MWNLIPKSEGFWDWERKESKQKRAREHLQMRYETSTGLQTCSSINHANLTAIRRSGDLQK